MSEEFLYKGEHSPRFCCRPPVSDGFGGAGLSEPVELDRGERGRRRVTLAEILTDMGRVRPSGSEARIPYLWG